MVIKKSISEKSFDFSEILFHSYISKISTKKYQKFLEDIFKYILSNNNESTSFWKNKASLVLCLDILEHQDIIETDIGKCLQDYNQQLIYLFIRQNLGSRIEDLSFYVNLLLHRLLHSQYLLDEHKLMIIQLTEDLIQDLNIKKLDLTSNIIHFHVSILIKLYYLNIGYKYIIQSELKKIYRLINKTFQNQREMNIIWINNLFIYSDLSKFLQEKQLLDLKSVLSNFVANYEELTYDANWLDRYYFLHALIKFNAEKCSYIFNSDIERFLDTEKTQIIEIVGDCADFECRMLTLTKYAFESDPKNNALNEMLLIPTFS